MPLLLALAPELVVLVVAAFAMLLYLGYQLLHAILTYAIDHWGVVGRFVGGPIDSLFVAAYDSVKGWLLSALHPIVGLLSHPSVAMDTHTKANVSAHVHHQQVNQYIAGVVIPTQISDTRAAATNQVNGVIGYLNNAVIPAVQSSLHSLQGELDQDATALRSIEAQLAQLSTIVVGGHLAEAVAGLQSVVGTVQTQLAQAYQDLAAQAGGIQSVAAEAAGAYGYTDTQVRRATETVEDQAAAGDSAVKGDVLDGLRIGNPALPAELTSALSAVAAAAATATTYVDECGAPLCDWAAANQNNLASLFGALDLGIIGALVATAVEDPGAVARAMASIGDEVRSVGDTVLSTLGVPT